MKHHKLDLIWNECVSGDNKRGTHAVEGERAKLVVKG